MASSSSPSSSSSSKSRALLSKLLRVSILILLLVNPCSATRLGMAAPASRVAMNLDRPRRQEGVTLTSFRHRGRVFNFFPKGATVPPSGPSKRHNDVIDSDPQD